ncbi:MAG: hypothetical protein LBL46_04260 [Rickettsiales bacterium]|jgi:hypothetical protein|nr:hypothetical protein [Rickettsiales bacterium]
MEIIEMFLRKIKIMRARAAAFSYSLILLFSLCAAGAEAAPNLTAEMNMNVSGSSAAAAKKDAAESALRGGIIQILARYSDRAVVENLIMGADDAALQNLVASTGIANEKSGKTAYSAKISITLDRGAAERWYNDNNVPNFLNAADESKDRSVIAIELPGGLADWAALNQVIRDDGGNYELSLRSIFRNSATAYVLTSKRRKMTGLLSADGWRVWTQDGVVRVSK